jgi:RIO-like serine/threonine protein kinase
MIPKFLASVHLPSCDTDIPQKFLKYFDIRGILMEYIEGFSLSELKTKTPQSQWQVICDDAIHIVNLIGDHEILNNDVCPENFLVRSNPGANIVVGIGLHCLPWRQQLPGPAIAVVE